MQLELSVDDRDLLARLIEREIGEVRSEVRRTREPSFHDFLIRDEERLKAILEQLRKLGDD
jgi:hypothetical protein